MKKRICTYFLFIFLSASTSVLSGEVKLETLLKEKIERVEKTEVIVSNVDIAPNTSLAKHWHPGEEFVYVKEGAATLLQEGRDKIILSEGDVFKIPMKLVHSAFTGEEGASLLIFRVHEEGRPERIMVE